MLAAFVTLLVAELILLILLSFEQIDNGKRSCGCCTCSAGGTGVASLSSVTSAPSWLTPPTCSVGTRLHPTGCIEPLAPKARAVDLYATVQDLADMSLICYQFYYGTAGILFNHGINMACPEVEVKDVRAAEPRSTSGTRRTRRCSRTRSSFPWRSCREKRMRLRVISSISQEPLK